MFSMYGGNTKTHTHTTQYNKSNNNKGINRNALKVSDFGKQSQNLEAPVLAPRLMS